MAFTVLLYILLILNNYHVFPHRTIRPHFFAGQRMLELYKNFPDYHIEKPSEASYTSKNENESFVRRRRATQHYFVGRVRGQTQSQYINFGTSSDNGRAEAEYTNEGSRAIVIGSNGMGQAQSQSYDCENCTTNEMPRQVQTINYGGMGSSSIPQRINRENTQNTNHLQSAGSSTVDKPGPAIGTGSENPSGRGIRYPIRPERRLTETGNGNRDTYQNVHNHRTGSSMQRPVKKVCNQHVPGTKQWDQGSGPENTGRNNEARYYAVPATGNRYPGHTTQTHYGPSSHGNHQMLPVNADQLTNRIKTNGYGRPHNFDNHISKTGFTNHRTPNEPEQNGGRGHSGGSKTFEDHTELSGEEMYTERTNYETATTTYMNPIETNQVGRNEYNRGNGRMGPSSHGYAGPSNHAYMGPSSHGHTGDNSHNYVGPSSHGYVGPSSHGYVGPSSHGDLHPSTHGNMRPSSHGYVGPSSHGDTGPSSHGYLGPSSHGDIGSSSHGGIGSSSHGDIGPSSHGDIGPSSHGDIGPSSHGDIGPDSHGDIGPSSHGDIGSSSHGDVGPSNNHGYFGPSSHGYIGPSSVGHTDPSKHAYMGASRHGSIGPSSHGHLNPSNNHDYVRQQSNKVGGKSYSTQNNNRLQSNNVNSVLSKPGTHTEYVEEENYPQPHVEGYFGPSGHGSGNGLEDNQEISDTSYEHKTAQEYGAKTTNHDSRQSNVRPSSNARSGTQSTGDGNHVKYSRQQGPADQDDGSSQSNTSIHQTVHGIQANASAQGNLSNGVSQSHVSGLYTGSGSFSASAGTDDGQKGTQTQVNGGQKGILSSAHGRGGNVESQSEIRLLSEAGNIISTAQSSGYQQNTLSEIQTGSKGGLADAQANGLGSTSSQAQIGLIPKSDDEEYRTNPFSNVTANAQGSYNSGQSQTQIQGASLNGLKFTGAAQASTNNQIKANESYKDDIFTQRVESANNNKDALLEYSSSFSEMNENNENVKSKFSFPDTVTEENNQHNHKYQSQPGSTFSEDPVFTNKPINNSLTNIYNNGNHIPKSTIIKITSTESTGKILSENNTVAKQFYGTTNLTYPFMPASETHHEGYVVRTDTPDMDYNEDYDDYNDEYDQSSSGTPSVQMKTIFKQYSRPQKQHITLDRLENLDTIVYQTKGIYAQEGTVLQPGETVPGSSGIKIPEGFRGRVKSSLYSPKAYAVGKNSQAQSIALTPGTGKIIYANSPRKTSIKRI